MQRFVFSKYAIKFEHILLCISPQLQTLKTCIGIYAKSNMHKVHGYVAHPHQITFYHGKVKGHKPERQWRRISCYRLENHIYQKSEPKVSL